MNIKVNDNCLYKGTKKPCKVLHILNTKAWITSEDNDEGHIIDLEHSEAIKQGARVFESSIEVNTKLYFSTEEAANTYSEYILLENEMVVYMNRAWEKANKVLNWFDDNGKYVVAEEQNKLYNTYSINQYHFIALPSDKDVEAFRELFTDSEILSVTRRPQ